MTSPRTTGILAALVAQSLCGGASILLPPSAPPVDLFASHDLIAVDHDESVVSVTFEPVVLAPVRQVRRGNTKRDRRAALELKTEETLYWSGQDGTAAALTVSMPGENENIVNLELIDDMVQSVSCPSDGVGQFKIQFAEEADFDDAQDIWQWVNQAAENSFVLIVGAGGCGWNEGRVVYDVASLAYDDSRETAVLNVKRTSWKEAAHTFDLTVGKPAAQEKAAARRRLARGHSRRGLLGKIGGAVKGAASSVVDTVSGAADAAVDVVSGVADEAVDTVSDVADEAFDTVSDVADDTFDAVRGAAGVVVDTVGDAADEFVDAVDSTVNPDVSPDFIVPFRSDFSNKSVTFSQDGVDISASCVQCFTTGSIDIQGRFRARQFQIEEAWIEASTEGLSAKAVLGLTLKGELTDTLAEKSVPVFKVSPAGVSIPGVLTIGPTVSVSLGAEISKVKGGVTVSFGGTATIPPSITRLDFLSQEDTVARGWKPSFKAEPFKAEAFIEASAAAFLKAAVGLEISAVGMDLSLPFLLTYLDRQST